MKNSSESQPSPPVPFWERPGHFTGEIALGKDAQGLKRNPIRYNVTDPSFRLYLMEASDSAVFLLSLSMEIRRRLSPQPHASSTDKCKGERLNEPLEIILHPRQQTNYHDYDNPIFREWNVARWMLCL